MCKSYGYVLLNLVIYYVPPWRAISISSLTHLTPHNVVFVYMQPLNLLDLENAGHLGPVWLCLVTQVDVDVRTNIVVHMYDFIRLPGRYACWLRLFW